MRVFEAVACESSKGLTIYIGPSFFFFSRDITFANAASLWDNKIE